MSVTKDEVPDKVKVNNVQLIASFKELLKDTAGHIKRANDTSAATADERGQGTEISRTAQV